MMPIRDVVIFPYMMTPFVVGRESSVRALEDAMAGDKKIFLATQHDASIDEPRPNEIFSVGMHRQHRAEPQAAGREHQGSGGRRRAGQGRFGDRRRRLLPRRGAHLQFQGGGRARSSSSWSARVTTLFEQYVKLSQNLNYETMVAAIRVDDAGQARRYRGRQPAAHHRREAGTARNLRSHRPPDPRGRDARYRDREAQRGPHHPGPREAPDGEGAERVLPQREDQGHPEGTGPRRKERNRRAEEAHRDVRHDEGRAREGAWRS